MSQIASYGRVALFGGVYNNHVALRAAIEDARRRGCERLLCLGDLGAFGPNPDKVFPLLIDAGVETMQGNYDNSIGNNLADCQCGYTDPADNHYARLSYQYTYNKTSAKWRPWLAQLPREIRFGLGKGFEFGVRVSENQRTENRDGYGFSSENLPSRNRDRYGFSAANVQEKQAENSMSEYGYSAEKNRDGYGFSSSENRDGYDFSPSSLNPEPPAPNPLRVLCCHGSPRKTNEFLWESTTPTHLLEKLCDDFAADVIVATHTGLPWTRELSGGRLFVNCGVLGRPANDGTTKVGYTILDASRPQLAEYVPLAYDHDALAAEMEAERLPPPFVETIRTGWWTTCLEVLPAKERARGKY